MKMQTFELTTSTIGTTTGLLSITGAFDSAMQIVLAVATIICAASTLVAAIVRIYAKVKEFLSGRISDKEFSEEIDKIREKMEGDLKK